LAHAVDFSGHKRNHEYSIWDVATGKKISDLSIDRDANIGISEFSPDGSLWAASNYNKLEIYNVASGKLQASIDDSSVGS
jgi:WD40 repeat protein